MIYSLSPSDWYLVIVSPLFFTFAYIVILWPYIQQPQTYNITIHQKRCKFKPVSNISSTERDAIFTATTVFNPKIEYLIKTFRTTGSHAKLFIFTPSDVYIPEFILGNDVYQIKTTNPSTRALRSPYKIRWEWYYQFLLENEEKFDRIMHTDAFDAVFFGDPFSLIDSKEKLYVQLEDKMIKQCPYNKRWIKQCHDFVPKDFYRNTIACSGSLAGGSHPFKLFIEAMITHEQWPVCWGHGSDQGDFNYVLWSQYYQFPFEIVQMNCHSGFTTMNYCASKNMLFNRKGQLIAAPSFEPIVYAHQYNRFEKALKYVENICS